ncbi:MAG: cytochrome c [Rhodocyclaceae bacterium]|nr:cytochrome c [Rhodocyclaceae bacterium]
MPFPDKKTFRKALATLAFFVVMPAYSEDPRQFVRLTPQAQETLRQEMLDNLMALVEILSLIAEDKFREAGILAEERLGRGAMGKNARLPFDARPGPQMPAEMHRIGIEGHFAASEFARAAIAGDKQGALAKLPAVLGQCVACHAAFRTR